ncbi:twin transmembrane helix small protein [Ramlibacter sp. PS4R-6]|uniref:twin transmembrane helix small protein n=1 Tax=Ramlibacter sp. PS4R-6 TaxID=3133438 RepID=UPI00309AA130
MIKVLVAVAFLAIVGSLGSALFFMMRTGKDDQGDKRRGDNMARALALRIGLSVLLFVCILVAWKLGWIQPTGIPVGK